MPELTIQCPSCGRSVKGRNLRTCSFGDRVQPVCRTCFLKLKLENGNDRERKPKLREQVAYSQDPLPF